jgi:hypothetical protein
MFRYCVLSIPRTGSTWLTNGIGFAYHRFANYVNLHEFFTPFTNQFSRYQLDNNNMIKEFTELNPYEVLNPTDFINSRMDLLLSGDINQPLVLKYMYWTRNFNETNDLDNLQKIQNHKIIIVNLVRDEFESALSSIMSQLTGINHRWQNPKGQYWSTSNGEKTEIDISRMNVCALDFQATYFQMKQANIEKQKIADLLGCTTVNYNNLRFECIDKKIPFQQMSFQQMALSRKLYDIGYSEIIKNYDELLEIRHAVDSKWTLQ